MLDLGGLLGQDELVARLVDRLEDPEVLGVRLTGPAGSGKSYVARSVATNWRENGGICVVAVGDDDHSWRDLYPLLSGLSQAPADWSGLATTGSRAAVRAADAALLGSGAGTSIFDLLTAALRQGTERALKPYSNLEKDVILDLKRLARSRRLLLVADNAHWWDPVSLSLVNAILSDPLRSSISQLESVVVLLVDTADEQKPVSVEQFEALASKRMAATLHTERCSPDQFQAVLEGFGISTTLPEEVCRELFTVTHGHLKLAEQIVAYAEEHDVDTLLTTDGSDYLSKLVAARFESLGSSGTAVTDLLMRAAVLGLSFTEGDLICISGEDQEELRDLVERAEQIGFLESTPKSINFSHDVIRAALLRDRGPSELRSLYEKLSGCLTILRPGDYEARAHALLEARDHRRARDVAVHAGVAQIRRGVPASRVQARHSAQFPGDPELISFLGLIGAGYAAVDNGNFAEPLPGLLTPEPTDSFAMAAEKNYLAALCLMELETPDSVKEAREILDSWIGSLDEEVELRLRFLALLQQAQIHSEMFDDARSTERRIGRELLRRIAYDADAAVMLQIQNRRAAAVNVPQIAADRIEEAVEFFRSGTEDGARDHLELFRSLTNLCGIQIKLGKDAAAYQSAQEAEEIALASPDVTHRLDVLASNAVLCGLRSGELSTRESIERQRVIVHSPQGCGDNFLQRCNLVAYLLLDGQTGEAETELEALGEELRSSERQESFLLYHWIALALAIPALRGESEEARRWHRAMGELVAELRWPAVPYVRRRQELLDQIFEAPWPDWAPEQFDTALLDRHPSEVGPAWTYYARLIPTCELSFWSDS